MADSSNDATGADSSSAPPEASKSDSSGGDSSKADSSAGDSSKADSSGGDSSGGDSSKADSSGGDSSAADSSKADSGGADSSNADSSNADSSNADSSNADSSGAASGGADSSGADSTAAGSGDGGAPTVTATIAIDPDDQSQSPNSLQVPRSAKLTLSWSSTNATSVDISPLSSGQPPSGSQALPTQEATYALTAHGASGSSQPFVIAVHTHDDDEVVSGHCDVSSGQGTSDSESSSGTGDGAGSGASDPTSAADDWNTPGTGDAGDATAPGDATGSGDASGAGSSDGSADGAAEAPTINSFLAFSTDNAEGSQGPACTPGTVVTIKWDVSNNASTLKLSGPGAADIAGQFTGSLTFTVPNETDAAVPDASGTSGPLATFTLSASNSAGAAADQIVKITTKATKTLEMTAEQAYTYPLVEKSLHWVKASIKVSLVPAIKLDWIANGDPPASVTVTSLADQIWAQVKGLAAVASWSTITDAQLINDGSQLSPTGSPAGNQESGKPTGANYKLSIDQKWKLMPAGVGLQVSCVLLSVTKDQKSGAWDTHAVNFEGEASKDFPFDALPLGDGNWQISGVVSGKLDVDVEPDWEGIAGDVLKAVGTDVAIAASIVAAGVLTVVIAFVEISAGWALEDMANALDATEKSTVAGYMAGLSGQISGGDDAYNAGAQAGTAKRNDLIANNCGGDAGKLGAWLQQNTSAVQSIVSSQFTATARKQAFINFANAHKGTDLTTLMHGWMASMGNSPASVGGDAMTLWSDNRPNPAPDPSDIKNTGYYNGSW